MKTTTSFLATSQPEATWTALRTAMPNRLTTALCIALCIALFAGLGACAKQSSDPVFDAQSSAAYRAAWEKRRSGDVEGARAMINDVAKKYPNTRAGQRAKDESAPPTKGMVSLFRLVTALSKQLTPKADTP